MLPSLALRGGCLLAIFIDLLAFVRPSPYFLADEAESDEHWRDPKKCDKKCPYGFKSDVEGLAMCQCHDPCSLVLCLGGLQCIVEKPRFCRKEPCKFFAACKNVNVCDLPKDDVTDTQCERKIVRWFFDKKTGKCKRFFGCRARGNNFGRKRDCKKKCYKRYGRHGRGKGARSRKQQQSWRAVGSTSLSWVFPRCPMFRPRVHCSVNPCSSCKDRSILCIPNYCGKCSVLIYVDLKTGKKVRTCSPKHNYT